MRGYVGSIGDSESQWLTKSLKCLKLGTSHQRSTTWRNLARACVDSLCARIQCCIPLRVALRVAYSCASRCVGLGPRAIVPGRMHFMHKSGTHLLTPAVLSQILVHHVVFSQASSDSCVPGKQSNINTVRVLSLPLSWCA